MAVRSVPAINLDTVRPVGQPMMAVIYAIIALLVVILRG